MAKFGGLGWLSALLVVTALVTLAFPTVRATQEASPATGDAATPASLGGRLVATIPLPGPPWRVASGAGAFWVLTRGDDPALVRLDPAANRAVGEPIPLPFDPWDLAVGEGALWVTSNGGDGVVVRIDPASGRIVATIGGGANVLGPFVAVGAGAVWTGNGDERAAGGHTVSRIDPTTNTIVGPSITIRGHSEGIAVGNGAVWVCSHDVAELTRIDPATNQVVASIALGSDPHGVAVGDASLWVGLYHDGTLARVDPVTNRVVAKIPLGFGGTNIAVGPGGAWTYAANPNYGAGHPADDRIARVALRTNRVAETLHVGGVPAGIAADEGTVWVAVHDPDAVLRIRP